MMYKIATLPYSILEQRVWIKYVFLPLKFPFFIPVHQSEGDLVVK